MLLLDCSNQLIGALLTCVRGPLFTTIHNHMNVVNILLRMVTLLVPVRLPFELSGTSSSKISIEAREHVFKP